MSNDLGSYRGRSVVISGDTAPSPPLETVGRRLRGSVGARTGRRGAS